MLNAAVMNLWGPALLVCFSLLMGMFFQNSRLNDTNARIADLKDSMNRRIDDLRDSLHAQMADLRDSMNKQTADLRDSMNKQMEDLKSYLGAEFKRVDERIDRLESPLARK
jgi:DNA anti-recombination protein RmuC